MFRAISIAVFVVTLAGIALHYLATCCREKEQRWRPVNILKKPVYLLTLLFLPQHLSLLGKLNKLVYLVAMLCFVVLAFTGFYPALVLGQRLSGYFLMVHVSAGGAFAVCMAILALCWAQQNRFAESDWPWLVRLCYRRPRPSVVWPTWPVLPQKVCFWLGIVLTMPLALSIALSMFPLLGTQGQFLLADAHRYTALAFAVVAIVHTYLMVRTGYGNKIN